jgi:AraC-like DNA-binding protein
MSVLIDDEMTPAIHQVIFRKCTPAWAITENSLEDINLTYIVEGAARYTINAETVDVEQGDLLVLPKDSLCKAITFNDRPMHCFSVDFILKNSRSQELPPPLPLKTTLGRHENIIHLFHELSFTWASKQPGYIMKSRGLFLQILHRFLEIVVYRTGPNTGDYRISRIVNYITAHYSEHITVKMMADMVNLNSTYFGVLFRQTMGMSLNQFLIQTRVTNAEHMLNSGEYKVGDVAEVCGFTDVSHFYKQFKQSKGFPPSHSMPKKF